MTACEQRRGGEVAVCDGFDGGGVGWDEASVVEEFDGVGNGSCWKNAVGVPWFVLVVRRVAKWDA